MTDRRASQEAPPHAYDGLDRTIHEKARLGVMTSLISRPEGLAFAELKRLCGLTDGNLSRHLSVLEAAGLVAISKTFEKNRPLTTCALTPQGRERFLEYISVLERVVRCAAEAQGVKETQGAEKTQRTAATPERRPDPFRKPKPA